MHEYYLSAICLILSPIACESLVYLIRKSDAFKSFRNVIEVHNIPLAMSLLRCGYCASFWPPILFYVLYYWWPTACFVLIVWLSTQRLANLYHNIQKVQYYDRVHNLQITMTQQESQGPNASFLDRLSMAIVDDTPDGQYQKVTIESLDELKALITSIINNDIRDEQRKTRFEIDGKTYESVTNSPTLREQLVDGFNEINKLLKNPSDEVFQQNIYDLSIHGTHRIDSIIDAELGGIRVGSRVKWAIGDKTIFYDFITGKLSQAAN